MRNSCNEIAFDTEFVQNEMPIFMERFFDLKSTSKSQNFGDFNI